MNNLAMLNNSASTILRSSGVNPVIYLPIWSLVMNKISCSKKKVSYILLGVLGLAEILFSITFSHRTFWRSPLELHFFSVLTKFNNIISVYKLNYKVK